MFRLEHTSLRLEAGDPEGLAGLVFASDDIEHSLLLDDTQTRGVSVAIEPALHERPFEASSSDTVHDLDHVVVMSHNLDAARSLWEEQLGLRLALDRSFPERRTRILFLRIGGVTLEVGGRLEDPEPAGRDTLWGLAWKVGDVAAARERLHGLGFDVSEVRPGRKPGTRVCTVRDGTHAVPTLIIGPDPSTFDAMRRELTHANLVDLAQKLELYKLDHRRYPTNKEGLTVIAGGNSELLLDPWGNPFTYKSPGEHNTDSYDLSSYGPNGLDDDGRSDDIANW